MDVSNILTLLRQERERLDEAILTMERLRMGDASRSGLPPGGMGSGMPRKRGRPPGSKNKSTLAHSNTSAA